MSFVAGLFLKRKSDIMKKILFLLLVSLIIVNIFNSKPPIFDDEMNTLICIQEEIY